MKFLAQRVYAESFGTLSRSIFLPFFAGWLNFCINGKQLEYRTTEQNSHFSKIINAHGDALLLHNKTISFSLAKQLPSFPLILNFHMAVNPYSNRYL